MKINYFYRRQTDRQTDGMADGRTDGVTDGTTDRQTLRTITIGSVRSFTVNIKIDVLKYINLTPFKLLLTVLGVAN